MKERYTIRKYVAVALLGILSITVAKAGDVIVTVTVHALLDTQLTAVDSILIVNESNNTTMKLGGLSQSATAYQVNLSTGIIQSSTDTEMLSEIDKLTVSANESGIKVHALLNSAQYLNITVVGLDGRLVASKAVFAQNGYTDSYLKLQLPGIYLVNVIGFSVRTTVKVIYSPTFSTVSNVSLVSQKMKSDVQGFSYVDGNRIQVVVRKGSVKSPVWYGKPANGTLIQLSVPTYTQVFDMKQTLSKGAQINTISFSGVAFFSGCYYASTFYPPGKVADYFGFQYMRDNDPDESGHNTDFLTKAAYHMMHILNATQLQGLIDLAVEQDSLFRAYALNRMILIKAFHRYLDNDLPTGATGLNQDSVKALSRKLYETDAEISYGRALKFASIIQTLSEEQRDTLYRLGATGMKVWTMPEKPQVVIPRDMNTWVMSNASELFSWFLRGVDADIYFCPERQGTYFGGF